VPENPPLGGSSGVECNLAVGSKGPSSGVLVIGVIGRDLIFQPVILPEARFSAEERSMSADNKILIRRFVDALIMGRPQHSKNLLPQITYITILRYQTLRISRL
jgi:hypothetical protein